MRYLFLLVLALTLTSGCKPAQPPSVETLQAVNATIEIGALVAQTVCTMHARDHQDPALVGKCRNALIPVVDGAEALAHQLQHQGVDPMPLAGCVAKALAQAHQALVTLGVPVPREFDAAVFLASPFAAWAQPSCNPSAPQTVVVPSVDPALPSANDVGL